MKTIVDYVSTDFCKEITELFAGSERNFNFGEKAIPVDIVKQAVLKSVCGWHNGSTAQSIIMELGYVVEKRKGGYKLTPKGQAFMWWAFEKRNSSEPPDLSKMGIQVIKY